MTKQIVITIEEPTIKTNPPQPDKINLKVEGLMSTEAILILINVMSQIANKELPVIGAYMKQQIIKAGTPK